MTCQVLAIHPTADRYGSDRMLGRSLTAVARAGVAVCLEVSEEGPLLERFRSDRSEVTVVVSSFPVLRRSELRPLRLLALVVRIPFDVLRMVREIRRIQPAVVLVNTITVPHWLVAARLARVRAVCHVHELESALSPWFTRALLAPLLLAAEVMTNSEATRQHVTGSWPRLAARTSIILNGIDIPDEPPDRLRVGQRRRITCVGRLSPRKGQDVAIEAIAQLVRAGYDLELELVGTAFRGYEWFVADLRRAAAAAGLGDRLLLPGFSDDVWTTFGSADIAIVPSRLEPFGTVAVEALASGTPTVVSDVGGLPEIVDDSRTGLVVPPNDPAALAAALRMLLDAPEFAAELAAAGREDAIRRFSGDRYDAEFCDFVLRQLTVRSSS